MYELNDDMDELFRRAAKDYPLDTNSADWNKLQEAMQKADSSEGSFTPVTTKKSNRRFLWLLLLLLPLPWLCYEHISNNRDGAKPELVQANNTGKTVAISDPNKTGNSNSNTMSMKEEQGTSPAITKLSNEKARDRNPAPAPQSPSSAVQPVEESNPDKQTSATENNPVSSSGPVTSVIKKAEKSTDSTATKPTPEKKEEKQKENKKDKKSSKTKGLYIGVIGGPDLSSVKLQAIKNVGLNGGALIGYQWNKRFSAESEVVWNKKYYYSTGQYFSTEKVYLPPNTKIGNVIGDCEMIEWAVNLRYNLKSKGANSWSAVAGLSSYFMKREDYNYQYLYSNGQTDDRYKTYKNSSNNWLSIINLGFTYSHTLGRTGTLRIEPYLKLPVKGLGIGSLPIMSTGLNVGFIKKIF